MALPNVKGMTKAQIDAVLRELNARRAEIEKETVAKVREQINAILVKNNLKLGDVFPRLARPARGRADASTAKYRDPKDHAKSWSGRGKRPQWFKAALAAGAKPESLLAK